MSQPSCRAGGGCCEGAAKPTSWRRPGDFLGDFALSLRDPMERFFQTTLRLSHLRTLASLADLGQVRRVAEAFHVTQSAISKQLAEIEAGLGEAVVRREGNGLVLTPIGQRLAMRAREILHQLARTHQEISALRHGLGGRVALGAVTAVNVTLVPRAIRRLRQRAPGVAVALEEDTADRLLPRLLDRSLDVAVVRMWHPLAYEGLAHRVLMHEAMVMTVGAQHPLAGRRELAWAAVMDYPWIVPKQGSPAHGALAALLASHGLRIPEGQVESISLALNLALLALDDFIGLLPRAFAAQCVREGRIAVLPLETADLLSEIRVFWREGDTDPTCALLLECLAEACTGA